MFSQGGQEKVRVCHLWCFQKLFVVASFSAQEALEVLRGRNMAKQNTKREGHAKATKPTNVEKNPTFFLNRLSKKGTLVLLKKLFLWGLGAVPALRKLRGLLKAMGTAMGSAKGREVKVTTLDGGDLTVEVKPKSTIKELKAMLQDKKHGEDTIERQISRVKVLVDGLLVGDDQTVESAGLLHPEAEATVIYSRNEVEAATRDAIHAEGLLQVNIPVSLTEISAGAFEQCHQVVKVAIPESVTSIGQSAFRYCKSLASITIPVSVTSIGDYAFKGCWSLTSITMMPEASVTAIGGRAFAICSSLASITIPESVTVIGEGAFRDCSSLASITIPQSVTAIADFAFADCSSLGSITIPNSVTAIGQGAFFGCESLTSITIPSSVRAIGQFAFGDCKSLASITTPEILREDVQFAFDDDLQAIVRYVWLQVFLQLLDPQWAGQLLFSWQMSASAYRKERIKPKIPNIRKWEIRTQKSPTQTG